MIYKFGEFELDRDRFELRRAGAPRPVEPKVFDLLVCLAESKGRVVTRDELLDQVWSGRIVSDATLSSAVQAARAALDDSGREQRWIRTARGRGFRFAGEVESIGPGQTAAVADAPHVERRLAAILAADACEYSARMERDEQATLAALADLRSIIERRIAEAHGRIFSRAGDGFLAEFQSPVSAVRAGFEIQRDVALARSRNPNALNLRLGVHLADVVVDGDDLLGDGVNIAARIESVSAPGGVTVSQPIFDQVKRGASLTFEELGPTPLKNISEPVPLFRVLDQIDSHSYMNGANFEVAGAQLATEEDPRPSIAVLPFNNLSNDSEQDYFADGFTEDLITELARYRALFVSSRNASLAYRGHNASLAEVGRHLGVEYCLEGSVRRMGSRLRLSVQLSRADTEESIWADRYDSPMEEIFDV